MVYFLSSGHRFTFALSYLSPSFLNSLCWPTMHLPRWLTSSVPELPLRNLSNLISPPLFHFLPSPLICLSQQSPDPGAEHLSHDSGQLSPKPPALWFSVHLQICLISLSAVYRLSLYPCVFIAPGWSQSRNWSCMTWSCQSGLNGGGGSRHVVLGWTSPTLFLEATLATLFNTRQNGAGSQIYNLCTHRGNRQSMFS